MRSVFIPITPVPWARPRASRNGGFFTAKKQKMFAVELEDHMRSLWNDMPWDGAITVSINVTLQRPKGISAKKRPWPSVKPDLDNLIKAVLDSATGILWVDDAQIVDMACQKRYGTPGIWIGVGRYE